jgi:hypothetical protein
MFLIDNDAECDITFNAKYLAVIVKEKNFTFLNQGKPKNDNFIKSNNHIGELWTNKLARLSKMRLFSQVQNLE